MKIIKKYGNRCLYDSELSANVTLQDLKQYVMDSVPFKVINAKTKEDLTRTYLIHIILELEGMNNPLFTQASLEHIIRFYGHPLQASIKQYLDQVLTTMVKQQELFKSTQKNDFFDSLGAITAKNIELWQNIVAAATKNDKNNKKT